MLLQLNAGNITHDLCGWNLQLARVVHQHFSEAAHWCDDKDKRAKQHTLR